MARKLSINSNFDIDDNLSEQREYCVVGRDDGNSGNGDLGGQVNWLVIYFWGVLFECYNVIGSPKIVNCFSC